MNPMIINRQAASSLATQNVSISAIVVLGNPRYPDCSQHGICRIDTSATPNCGCRHQTKAWLSVPQPGVVRLVFEYAAMQEASVEYFFQNSHFLIDSGYLLPDSIMEKLGLPGELLLIEPGEYLISRYAGFLEITFQPPG
ncbi:MAG: hypothetical protein IT262_07525 [Saprospiraceae bacterium]|jgi:hypothetical protein|nr:hypothetical protein [Saprospiraceae bacterium]